MRRMTTCLLCVVACALLGCTPVWQDSKIGDVSLLAPQDAMDASRFNSFRLEAERRVVRVLPDAYYQGMVLFSEAQDLAALRGRLVFVYGDVRRRLLSKRFISAAVDIQTQQGLASFSFEDLTEYYPSLEPMREVEGAEVHRVASMAAAQLASTGRGNWMVVMTQLGEHWDIHCVPADGTDGLYLFEIRDSVIHEIVAP